MDPIESKVEALANTILKTDAESWEIRNKAILQLGDIVMSFKDESDEVINEYFTANVFRTLKEPVKNMVRFSSGVSDQFGCELTFSLFFGRFWI